MPQKVVVFDSDVIIPLIIPASRSARLFSRLDAAGWDVAVTPQILEEVAEKLRTKESLRKWLRLPDERIEAFLTGAVLNTMRPLPGLRNAHGAVPADPDDDKIIAAALECDASYIVSEDRHLLDLVSYQGIKIMTRDQFAAELDRLGVPALETDIS